MYRRAAHVLALLAFLLAASPGPAPARASAYVDPKLQAALNTATPTDQFAVVVNFDPSVTSAAALATAVQDVGAGTLTFDNLDSMAALATPAQISAITTLGGVTGVYANAPLRYFLDGSVPYIGADRVWSGLSVTGRGVGMAIIDSGIDGTNPDVAYPSKTVQNVKVAFNLADLVTFKGKPPVKTAPYWVEGIANTDTTMGHGTHVAGTAAGNGAASGGLYTGVAKEAHLVGISTGETLFIIWALAGFDYAIGHRAQYNIKVINNSWGNSGGSGAWDKDDPINKASKKAHDAGITVVFAAGNDGPGPDTMNPYAEAPWVVGVAAGCKPTDTVHCVDANGNPYGLLADFSSRGVRGSAQFHPTLTAPGVHIVAPRATTGTLMNVLDGNHDLTICSTSARLTLAPYYTCASGTSMATPHVVGTVALMQQAAAGRLSPDQVKSILERTARPMYRPDGSPDGSRMEAWEVGAGYIDAYAAVKASR